MRKLYYLALRDVRIAVPVGIVLGLLALIALSSGIFGTNLAARDNGFGAFTIFGILCVRYFYRAYRLYTGKATPYESNLHTDRTVGRPKLHIMPVTGNDGVSHKANTPVRRPRPNHRISPKQVSGYVSQGSAALPPEQ